MEKTIKKCQKLWKWSEKLFKAVFAFWIIETVVFIIAEGWHLKATSEAEIICDKIVNIGFTIWLALLAYIILNILREFMEANWVFENKEK